MSHYLCLCRRITDVPPRFTLWVAAIGLKHPARSTVRMSEWVVQGKLKKNAVHAIVVTSFAEDTAHSHTSG